MVRQGNVNYLWLLLLWHIRHQHHLDLQLHRSLRGRVWMWVSVVLWVEGGWQEMQVKLVSRSQLHLPCMGLLPLLCWLVSITWVLYLITSKVDSPVSISFHVFMCSGAGYPSSYYPYIIATLVDTVPQQCGGTGGQVGRLDRKAKYRRQIQLLHTKVEMKLYPNFYRLFFNKIGFFVGQALKNLKLCCHFLSWKSSKRRNNLSYLSVTYPGSAGW